MKKIKILLLCSLAVLLMTSCNNNDSKKQSAADNKNTEDVTIDSEKQSNDAESATDPVPLTKEEPESIKERYEMANGGTEEHDVDVLIEDDSRLKEVDIHEFLEKAESGEDFVFYIGDDRCMWCRLIVDDLAKVSVEKNVNVVCVDAWNNGEERFREIYYINENNQLVKKDSPDPESFERLKALFRKNGLIDKFLYNTPDGKTHETDYEVIYIPKIGHMKGGQCVSVLSLPDDDDYRDNAYNKIKEYFTKIDKEE